MTNILQDGYAVIVLFRGDDGDRAFQMLRSAVNPEANWPVTVLLPDVRGLDFLSASGPASAGLNAWWQRAVRPGSRPVFLVLDESGLEDWIPGTDGLWFVGVGSVERERVFSALAEPTFPVVARDVELVAEQAMQALGGRGHVDPVFHPSFPYRQPVTRWVRAVPRLDRPAPKAADAAAPATPSAPAPTAPRAPARPISYEPEAAAPPPAVPRYAAPAGPPPPALRARLQSASQRLRSALSATARPSGAPPPRLGATINANRPMVAGFASRKGGVGKTTHAAATAATIGEAFDGLADTAALVDGNITNPDSWALNPPPDSATVRTLVSRLTLGQDPPAEQYARTPRLAIYPESRTSEESYTQAEVDIVAEYLRRRHSFIAVDLPNALPSLTNGGAGAVAAAWLMHCDVIVLPFNADPRARQGLLEYVEVLSQDEVLARVPVVAPYITSSNRAIAADPAVQADIQELRRRDVEVVGVPDDENALLALLRDLPINQASPGLRRAYIELTDRIVAAVLTARARR